MSNMQDRINQFAKLTRDDQHELYKEFLLGIIINFYVDAKEFELTNATMEEKKFTEKFIEFSKFWLNCRLKFSDESVTINDELYGRRIPRGDRCYPSRTYFV